MGQLKFGNQTLVIDQIPDGYEAVASSELAPLRELKNAYSVLKSQLPVDVQPNELSLYVDKGRKYESLVKDKETLSTEVASLREQVKQFSNIPKEFTIEQWNKDRKVEQQASRQQKMDALTKVVLEKVKTETKVDFKVDPRFIDQKIAETIDPDSPTAVDTWYKALDDAHTAQLDFITKNQSSITPTTPIPGQVGPNGNPDPRLAAQHLNPNMPEHQGDKVSDVGASLGKF